MTSEAEVTPARQVFMKPRRWIRLMWLLWAESDGAPPAKPHHHQGFHQYSIFRPNWIIRGPLALVMAPKPQANACWQPAVLAGTNGEPSCVANPPEPPGC